MQETDFSFSHLEQPAPGSLLVHGQHLYRGWIMPKTGQHVVDVRARLGQRIFPGIHGFPRPDLAAHFKTGQNVALAEFAIVLEIPPGRADIVLEALLIDGRWVEFQAVTYPVSSGGPRAAIAMPSAPLRWHEYGRTLQMLLREARAHPEQNLPDLARQLIATVPYPRDLRHPHPPFRGHLDEPAAITRCGFGRAAVLGFLFHETQPIKRVLATFDLQAWQTIEHQRPSPGPASHFPACTAAQHCGVFGVIDVPSQLPNPVCLRLYAELPDGSLHLCFVQRSRLYTNEDEKRPYASRDRVTFAVAREALDAAVRESGVEVVRDDDLQRELTRIEIDFDMRAPSSLPRSVALQSAPATTTSPLPRRVLLVTHNFNFEGAPLFFLDYARHLASLGVKLTVLSPEDGPLRASFAEIAVSTAVIEVAAIFAAHSKDTYNNALAEAARQFDFAPFDLVVCNTFTTFWAVHLAKMKGRRVLLYVHESTTPATFYVGRMDPMIVSLVEAAFGAADAVSFTTAATRAYHLHYGRPERHRRSPGWIDVAAIDRWRGVNARDALRRKFDLRENELLVTNVGTVCDRKGQHIFCRAVDLLWRKNPELAARTRFIMLGGGQTPFDAVLADLLAQLDRPNLVVHPATADYFPYYCAADLFVCSTYEESSPRVILEAMACEVPILASNVQGVPEQVRPDQEATLVPAGDTAALCDAMVRLLLAPDVVRAQAVQARTRVVREFDAPVLLPRHAALAAEVAAGKVAG